MEQHKNYKNNIIITIIIIGLLLGYIFTSGYKSQNVRLLDVLIIGPLMIYLGIYGFIKTNYKLYLLLILFGSSTITYNLTNFLIISKINFILI